MRTAVGSAGGRWASDRDFAPATRDQSPPREAITMHAPTSQRFPELDRLAAAIPGDGSPENPIHRWATDCALRYAISHHLEVARSRIGEAIDSCVRRESRGDLVETDDRGHFVPHHLTEIDALE